MTPTQRQVAHLLFESLAYFVAIRLYLRHRRTSAQGRPPSTWILVGAFFGAVVGSKLVFWLHRPDTLLMRLADVHTLLVGKTILGGLLGGVVGVEFTKKWVGERRSTGDGFVVPVLVGLMIGRIGCFLGGLNDATYGVATRLPWGVDFGDGIARHPTQLYEILFAALCLYALTRVRAPRAGDRFKVMMCLYLGWRCAVDLIKPQPILYFELISGIQLASLLGLVYYGPHMFRIGMFLWRQK